MKVKSGGGFRAIHYTFKKGREAGGLLKLFRAMRSRNACKTCALGMGGQKGGMVNEKGTFPEVCKKSLQAMVADMQPAITPDFWLQHSVEELKTFSPRKLENLGRLSQPVRYRRGEKYFQPVARLCHTRSGPTSRGLPSSSRPSSIAATRPPIFSMRARSPASSGV